MSHQTQKMFSADKDGAVDFTECPWPSQCKCGKCLICGYPKHSGIHGPLYREPAGSKPFGHAFVPEEPRA